MNYPSPIAEAIDRLAIDIARANGLTRGALAVLYYNLREYVEEGRASSYLTRVAVEYEIKLDDFAAAARAIAAELAA